MNYIAQERNLVKNLDDFYVLCHFLEKYAKARPTTEMLIELWSKRPVVVVPGTIVITPFDQKIKRIQVRTSENDPNVPEELIVTFPKQSISLQDCENRFGPYTLNFLPDSMTSSFCFEHIKTVFITKICCRYQGKFSETPEGNFTYIDPVNYERITIQRDKMVFKSFVLHFRPMGW